MISEMRNFLSLYGEFDFMLYTAAHGACLLATGFILFTILVFIDESTPADIEKYGITLFIAIFLLLNVPLGAYITRNIFGIQPPTYLPVDHLTASADEGEMKELATVADELSDSLSSPGDLTINQMRNLLESAVELSTTLKEKAQLQQEQISALLTEVEHEKKKAEESKRLAQQVTSIAKEQLEAVKLLITEDAKEEANKSFLYGLMVSFPIGVIASLFGSVIYRRLHLQRSKSQ